DVDRQWDNLKACRKANWQTPENNVDLAPAQIALLLREALSEARRAAPAGKFNERFGQWLNEAETLVAEIESDLEQSWSEELESRLQRLEQTCQGCHTTYRN